MYTEKQFYAYLNNINIYIYIYISVTIYCTSTMFIGEDKTAVRGIGGGRFHNFSN